MRERIRLIAALAAFALLAGCTTLRDRLREETELRTAHAQDVEGTQALAEAFSPVGLYIFVDVRGAKGPPRLELTPFEQAILDQFKVELARVGFKIADTRLWVRTEDPRAFVQHKAWGEQSVRGALADHPDWNAVVVLGMEEIHGRLRVLAARSTLELPDLQPGAIVPPEIVRGDLGFYIRSPNRAGVIYSKWERSFSGAFRVLPPKDVGSGDGPRFTSFAGARILRPNADEPVAPPAFSDEEAKLDLATQWRIVAYRVFAGDLFEWVRNAPLSSNQSRVLGRGATYLD